MDYGPVRVVKGRHKGRVGYYDDDEGRYAIVYFGEPFVEGYELVPRSALEAIDVMGVALARFRRRHPRLAAQLGLGRAS